MSLPEFRPSILACSVRVALGLAFCAAPLALHAGSPRVSSVYPGGGQRGTEAEFTLSGGNLKDLRTLLFDDKQIEVISCTPAGGGSKIKVKIAADAALGEHRFRAITESGVSDLRLFFVTPFPMVEERKKTKETLLEPQPVELGTTVYGHTPGDDQDRYSVELKKGQRLTAVVVGAHLQTAGLYDSALSITTADGNKLIESDDTAFGRQDPVASIVAPEDGKYIVTVRDSTNTGDGECQYFLHIGSFAQPLAVYPPGGPAGEEIEVKLLGDATGELKQKVKLPAKPDDDFQVYGNIDGPAPLPNAFRVSNFPNVLESEPNNDVEHATSGPDTLPAAFNGVISEKGDLDFFRFTAKKGQAYDLTVYARQLRSPLDSVLSLHNEKGAKMASNDDEGQPDSHLRWNCPTDGHYYISVGDQLNRGGSTYTYRVEVTPVEPKIVSYLPEITQNQNQDRRAIVVPKGNRFAQLIKTKRVDFGGDLSIDPVGLPAGIKVDKGDLDKSVDTIVMVFEAAADAAPAQTLINLTAKPLEAAKDATPLKTGVEHMVDVLENANNKSYYTVLEDKLPVSVAEAIPAKLSLVPFKAPILQNGQMNIKVHLDREGDFKGPVTITFLYVPPGIGSSGVAVIKEGETEGMLPISCNDKAALKKWKICVVGNADFGKGNTWFSTGLSDLEVAPAIMGGQIQRTFVDQSDSTTVTVALNTLQPFDGKAKIELMGLPPGCTSEVKEVTKDDKEVKFDVKASEKAMVGQHKQLFCSFKLVKDGEEMTSTFAMGGVLRVDKGAVAKNTAAPATK
ncbi:MAG TPA: pre-peptidase C-terminal domain-containing protein [Chthoniobacteraceae bacterium]|jgi:hypothetical protein|nr:pre-peptidase C-terminal domain-containing protein [Chthoniobacteraceae bacterium]